MIARAFEWKFVAKFAGIVLAGLGGTALSLYVVLPRGEAASFGEVIRALVTADNALSRAIAVALLVEAVVISSAVVLTAVLASHKIAGPLYRLKVAANELVRARGVRPIRLREYDQLRKTEESFNAMLAGLQDRFRSIDEACGNIADAAAKRTRSPGDRENAKAGIERLGSALGRFDL